MFNVGFEIEYEVMISILRIIRNLFGRKWWLFVMGISYGLIFVYRGCMLGINMIMYGFVF